MANLVVEITVGGTARDDPKVRKRPFLKVESCVVVAGTKGFDYGLGFHGMFQVIVLDINVGLLSKLSLQKH